MKGLSEILTVEEAAAYLKIPTSTIYKLAQENKIPGQKVGRHWRFHRGALDTWIARGMVIPDREADDDSQDEGGLDFS
jgi:excisionase family DNA binding protein